MTADQQVSADALGAALEAIRERTPLVQAITNDVVTNFTANVLLAHGATIAMVDIPVEAGVFAGIADGLLINLGTPHAEQREAMLEAAASAHTIHTPWVLDPVAVGALPVRTELAAQLLEFSPTVIRGNASEILALAGQGGAGRGVDAHDSVDAALDAARRLSDRTGAVVAVSGAVDHTVHHESIVRVANGHPLLTRITGGGCALGAVMAAYLGVVDDALTATVAASAAYEVAAQDAAAVTAHPGTFQPAFLDALSTLTPARLIRKAQLS